MQSYHRVSVLPFPIHLYLIEFKFKKSYNIVMYIDSGQPMKQLLILQSIVLFSVSALSSAPNQMLQQFSLSNHKGTIEIWSIESKQWTQLKDFSKLGIGSTIAVREHSELQITFEPAIFLTIKNNSILTINNLIKQPDKNIIRMSFTLQTGTTSLRMQSLASNTILFSLETPSIH